MVSAGAASPGAARAGAVAGAGAEADARAAREWRDKCVALAQRLEATEAELRLPRPADAARIRQLEDQARAPPPLSPVLTGHASSLLPY
jgi:hypothetical protein